jgi:hypothetical protein
MTAIRLSPSGPVIGNTGGAPLDFGPGARLRLTETNSVMGGSQQIPTATPDTINGGGFGDPGSAVVLTLSNPKQALEYRAKILLDVSNDSTNSVGEVILYLDTSIDGGVTYTPRVKNSHYVGNDDAGDTFVRQVELCLPLILGTSLGVDDSVPTPTLKLRARAMQTGDFETMNVVSLATSGTGGITGLEGTIHMELEECF